MQNLNQKTTKTKVEIQVYATEQLYILDKTITGKLMHTACHVCHPKSKVELDSSTKEFLNAYNSEKLLYILVGKSTTASGFRQELYIGTSRSIQQTGKNFFMQEAIDRLDSEINYYLIISLKNDDFSKEHLDVLKQLILDKAALNKNVSVKNIQNQSNLKIDDDVLNECLVYLQEILLMTSTVGVSFLTQNQIYTPQKQSQKKVDTAFATNTLKTKDTLIKTDSVKKIVIDNEQAYKSILATKQASLPVKGSTAQKYLNNCGIWDENIPSMLLFHKGLNYFDAMTKQNYGLFPCLLAPITDNSNNILSFERIFLTAEGNHADVPEPKYIMKKAAPLSGCSVKLYELSKDETTLGVAVDIESAIAAHAISKMPVWASVSYILLEHFDIPSHIKTLVIWADLVLNPKNSEDSSATKLKEKMLRKYPDLTVELYEPPNTVKSNFKKNTITWLDVLNHKPAGDVLNLFPVKWRKYLDKK